METLVTRTRLLDMPELTRLNLQNDLFDPTSNRLDSLQSSTLISLTLQLRRTSTSTLSPSIHGLLIGPLEGEEYKALRQAQLNGFITPAFIPTEGKESEIKWEVAKMWYEEIEKEGVLYPANLDGIGGWQLFIGS